MSTTDLEEIYDSEILDEFSLPESKAFVELAMLIVHVDRQVTDLELDELDAQLAALPFTDTQQERILGRHVDRTEKVLQQILDDADSIQTFVEDATDRLQGRRHRRHALELLVALAYADEPELEESAIYQEIGEAFGFDPQEREAIWHDHTGA